MEETIHSEASALRLYADESGNTGPDLIAGTQPFGVTTMVLLDADQERGIATAVAAAAGKARRALPRELKYSRLAKKAQGRRVLQGPTPRHACDAARPQDH